MKDKKEEYIFISKYEVLRGKTLKNLSKVIGFSCKNKYSQKKKKKIDLQKCGIFIHG